MAPNISQYPVDSYNMVNSSLSPIRDTLDSMYLENPSLDHWLGLDPVVDDWPSHPMKPDILNISSYTQEQVQDFELDLSKLSDLSEIKFDLDNMDDFCENSFGSPLIDNLHDKQSCTHILDDLIEGTKDSLVIDDVKHNELITNELRDIEFDLDYMDTMLNKTISLPLIDNLNDKVPVRGNHHNPLIKKFEEKDDLDSFLEDSLDGSDTLDEMEPLMGKLQDILDPLIESYQEISEVEKLIADKFPKKEPLIENIKVEVDPLAIALKGIFEESGNQCFLDSKVEVKDEDPVKQDCMWGEETRNPKKNRERQRKFSFTISQMMDTKGSMPDICNPTSSSLLTSSRKFSISIPDDFYLECPFDTPNSKEETTKVTSDIDMEDEEDYLNRLRKSMPGENSVIVVRKSKMSTKIEVEESEYSAHIDHNYSFPHKPQQKESISYGLLTPPQSEPDEEDGELSRQTYHGFKYHYRLPGTKKKKTQKNESKSLLKSSKHKIKVKYNFMTLKTCKSSPGEETKKTLTKTRGVKKLTKKVIAAQSERQRRVEIGQSFDIVKAAVPSLAKTDRVSKLEILAVATDYCLSLTEKGGKLKDRVEKKRKDNAELKKRLNKLRLDISRTVSIL